MMNLTAPNDMPNALAMRILGLFLVIFSIIEFGVGGAVYGFLRNVSVGAWWCAILTLVCGFTGLYSKDRQTVIAGCTCSVIGIIMTVIGACIDGIANNVFQGETGCFNTKTGVAYGTTRGKMLAEYCAGWIYGNYYDLSSWQCVCTDETLCYRYTLVSGQDCGAILTTYSSNLAASTAFCSLLCITVFVYSIFTCCTLCSGPASVQYAYNPAASATPVVVVHQDPLTTKGTGLKPFASEVIEDQAL